MTADDLDNDFDGVTEGWEVATLGDIGILYCGQSPSVSEVNTNGEGTPYVTGPEQWDGEAIVAGKWTTTPRRLVPSGCIFITVKGAGVGTLFPGIECAIGRDVYAYQPSDQLDRQFVMLALEFTIAEIKLQAAGDIPGLTKDHILSHRIGLPPAEEQARISAKVDELFNQVKAAQGYVRRAANMLGLSVDTMKVSPLAQSILKRAFAGELVETEADLARKEGRDYESASVLLERIAAERVIAENGKPKARRKQSMRTK